MRLDSVQKEESGMKSAWKLCVLVFLATSLVAQTSTAPNPKKAKAAPITAADVQALKDAIASQQAAIAQQGQQIQELREALQKAVMQAQTSATVTSGKVDAVQQQAAQQQQSVGELKTDVTDLKANVTNTALSLQETQKN